MTIYKNVRIVLGDDETDSLSIVSDAYTKEIRVIAKNGMNEVNFSITKQELETFIEELQEMEGG